MMIVHVYHTHIMCCLFPTIHAYMNRSKKFSFDFHMKVAKEVVSQIMSGSPRPEDLVNLQQDPSETKPHKETTKEGLLSDTRLWAEIMRNLSKDVYKSSSILLTGSALRVFGDNTDTPTGSSNTTATGGDVIAFSCGHAFTDVDFKSKVIIEFKEHVQNFPVPIPETLFQLQNCYKKLSQYPLACPYCVFQYLRQLQLQECPEVPIKPWTQ